VIASITRGKDAGALGVYLHGPGRHNEHAYNERVAGMVIAGSIPVTDPTKPGQWVANMRRAYRGRDDVSRPVWQCSLRTAPEDRRLSDAEWADAAQMFAERLGFAEHPWVAVRHADDHIHLALSRVAHDGRVWLGRHDYRTTQDARRALETELGLTQAPLRRGVSSERTEITQVQPGEFRMFAEQGRVVPRAVLAGQVLAAANTAAGRGRDAFEAELTERGIAFAVNQASTGTVSGYRFAAPVAAHADHNGEQVWFKASQLDKKLAWRVLSQVLEPLPVVETEQDFTTRVEAANDRHWYQVGRATLEQDWVQAGQPTRGLHPGGPAPGPGPPGRHDPHGHSRYRPRPGRGVGGAQPAGRGAAGGGHRGSVAARARPGPLSPARRAGRPPVGGGGHRPARVDAPL